MWALIFAGAGAAAGWWGWARVTYRAEGAVRLGIQQGAGVDVVGAGEDSGGALRLDEVIERELETLRGLAGEVSGEIPGEIPGAGVGEPDGLAPAASGEARDQLVIEARRAADAATRLVVTATATDPATAGAALRSVLAAYRATTALTGDAARTAAWRSAYSELNAARAEAAAARSRVAEARRAMSDTDAADAADDPSSAAGEYSGGGGASGGGGELEVAWAQANWTLNEARQAAEAVGRRVEALREMPAATVGELAAVDADAAAWRAAQREMDQRLAEAVWPPNPAAAARLTERTRLEARLRERAADTRILPIGDGELTFRAARLSEAEARLAGLRDETRRAEQAVARLSPRIAAWRKLAADAEAAEARLAAKEAALAQLDPGSGVRLVAAEVVGGGSVSPGDGLMNRNGSAGPADASTAFGDGASQGVYVWRDGRPAAAGLGAAIGCLAGAGLCGLVFLLDPRVRRSRDGGLVGSGVPVLGAVPTVGGTSTPPSAAGDGRVGTSPEIESIQSVRAVLEGRMRESEGDELSGAGGVPGAGGAFAVVGVGSGSGATSVAVGLAASMALSGSRVLLIDLAWLQKPAGASGDDQQATRAGLGVDGVIEELGYLDDEDRELITLGGGGDATEDALAGDGDPGDPGVGFGAMLNGASLRRSVVQTRLPGLAVLSAMGRGEALRRQWAGRVSSRWLSKLMQVSRRGGYAATIIDAGAATGSVEGMLGCAAADGTVVVVSQPETQADYDRAVTRLRLVGATILGTVLNRSDAKRLGRARKSSLKSSTAPVHHAGGLGRSSGSGIFAAAIEARSGKSDADSGSGMMNAPLPHIEDPSPPSPEASSEVSEMPIATETDAEPRGGSVFGVESPSIPPGVDPVSEPPAELHPTPARTPPPRPSQPPAATDVAETPAVTDSVEPQQKRPADGPAEPEIHVADDVMDQLVDHAIRAAAKRSRPASPLSKPDDE